MLAENGLDKGCQDAAQIGHCNVLANHQAFDLMKHGSVRQVGIPPVNLARRDNSQRRLAGKHGSGLNGGSMGAQDNIFRNIKRILHIPCRVIPWNVQGLEIVVVGFHFRPLDNVKTKRVENVANFFRNQGNRMKGALPDGTTGQGWVEALKPFLFLAAGYSFTRLFQQAGTFFLDPVSRLAHFWAFGRVKLWQAGHDGGYAPLASKPGDA